MPGVRLNLSRGGASVSVGGRGATVNVGKRGITSTVGIPGTGLSWSKRSGWSASKSSTNSQIITGMLKLGSKTLGQVEKTADKGNAIVTRLNKAIASLNGGRGVSASKIETFGRRVTAEEEKMVALEGSLEDAIAMFDAMITKLHGMSFGLFSGAEKRRRDEAVRAVSSARANTQKVVLDFGRLAESIAEKVSEVETANDGKS